MGADVFDNQLFDHWLNKKSQDILTKMDKEQVTTEDMLILTLKALTNHFHHMDVEFREEFKKIDQRFEDANKKIDQSFGNADKKIDQSFRNADKKIDQHIDTVEKQFDRIDKKFDRLYTALMWGFGLMLTSILGLYVKLFLG